MMGTDVNVYRAMIGLFSGISGRLQQKLFFLDKTTTVSFFVSFLQKKNNKWHYRFF